MRNSTQRLVNSRQTDEEKRRLAAIAAGADPNAEKPEEKDKGDEGGSGEYETQEEKDKKDKEKKDGDDAPNGDEKAFRDDSIGDRAAERDDVISAYRDCERHRIAAILNSPEGRANEKAAKALALDGHMPRDEAIAMLKAIGPGQKAGAGLSDRMSGVNAPNVGPADPVKVEGDRRAGALAIVNAGRRARGEEPLAQLPH